MKFIWTKSTILGGNEDLITWFLDEPCSHFAIEFSDGSVFHSSLFGVEFLTKDEFYSHRVKVFEICYPYARETKIKDKLKQFVRYKYDWLFFFWLTWASIKRMIFKIPLQDRIELQQTNGILCTEAIDLLPKQYNNNIDLSRVTTPYKLYNILRTKG